MKTVLILGAGFAGLELATRLSEELPHDVDVTIIDSSDAFVFGYSKLDIMFGREDPADVRLPYSKLDKPGVRFARETVLSIDAEHRRVTTDATALRARHPRGRAGSGSGPCGDAGVARGSSEYYSVSGAEHVRDLLPAFEGGNVIIGVLGNFFKCPAAPFETALMLHDYLENRGHRSATTMKVISPMSTPIPISPEASAGILEALAERDIEWWPESKVTSLDASSKVATLADGRTTPYDLFLAIPVHRAPRVIEESDLADDGWIAVDHTTFATKFENVYAVGDVTSAPVPRVGAIAEGEARTLAEVLVHQLRGGNPPEPYRGLATCYIEFGGSRVARFDANFLSGPTPFGTYTKASTDVAAAKVEFGATRRRRWFGIDS